MKVYQRCIVFALLCTMTLAGVILPLPGSMKAAHAASSLPDNWWRHVTGERRLKPIFNNFTLEQAQAQLATYKLHGYRVINLDWPVVSGPNSFNDGFTAEDYFNVDPRLTDSTATPDQAWSNFLTEAHNDGLAVDAWFNIGFAPPDANYFKQAEQEVAAGNTTGTYSDWFMWSTDPNAASPAPNNDGNGRRWVYDTTAGQYYWASWCTDDFTTCGPEFNWAKTSWQNEAKSILQHWFATGLDGVVLDNFAQNANITSEIAKSVVTDTIKAYGNNKFIVGECCSLIGNIDSIEDYTFQNANRAGAAAQAINGGDPSGLEGSFSYRDSIASSGGISYMMDYDGKYQYTPGGSNTNHSGQLLEIATVAAAGEFYVVRGTGYGNAYGDLAEWPSPDVDNLSNIFTTINNTPALQPAGTRKLLATNDNHKYYAFLRTSDDGSQKALVVLNYQPTAQTIAVTDTNLPNATTTDLLNNTSGPTISNNSMTVQLNAFGYGFYLLNSSTMTSNFSSGFESGDTQPTWTSTVDTTAPGGGTSNITGICCNLTASEATIRNENAHTGSNALLYSGRATASGDGDYSYDKVFDLSSQNLTVGASTTLSYWVYPQSSSAPNVGTDISGNNSTCVAIDLVFTDNTTLRDSGAVDENGNRAHPASQCGHLTLDTWNHVTVNLGTHSSGKTISRLDVGYDQPDSTGGYRGYIDDVTIA